MILSQVAQAFKDRKIKYWVVGGYAMALHGAIRGTVDVDVVIELEANAFEAAEAALKSIGLSSRLPVIASEVWRFREEYIRNRNLIAWSFFDPNRPTRMVDILIIHDARDYKGESIRIHGQSIQVISKRDLLKMKKRSGRPQDLEDAKMLEELIREEK